MSEKTSICVLASLPVVLAVGWASVQLVCDTGNLNAMFGRLGPPLWGGIFGTAVGCGFMLLGFVGLWIKRMPRDPRTEFSRTVSAICWSVLLGLVGAVALGAIGPSTRFFWFAGPGFPTKPLPLIGCGLVAGAIGGSLVGLLVGLTNKHKVKDAA